MRTMLCPTHYKTKTKAIPALDLFSTHKIKIKAIPTSELVFQELLKTTLSHAQ